MSNRNQRRQNKRDRKQNPANQQAQIPAPITAVADAQKATDIQEQQRTNGNDPPANDGATEMPSFWRDSRFWRGFTAFAELVFAGAIAYFAWVQADVSDRQLRAMVDQNNLMARQIDQADKTLDVMQAEQRAWIATANPTINELAEGVAPECSVTLRNTGNSPAILTAAEALVAITQGIKGPDAAVKLAKDVVIVEKRGTSIPPGAGLIINLAKGRELSKGDIDAINSGETTLWVFGRFRYTDVFQKERTTQCVLFYDPMSKAMRVTKSHNTMD